MGEEAKGVKIVTRNFGVADSHKLATYKGRGNVNGAGDYGFLLSTVDGDSQAVPGPDRLRLKVWDRATGTVIYDNQLGAADDAPAATTIAAGAITVSAPKRK